MNKEKHIPQGYKDSPLGIIPKEWEVKRLGDLCIDIYSGKNKVRVESGTYPVYGSTGIIGKTDEYKYDGDRILVARVGAHAGQVSSASGKYDVSDNTIIVENKEHYSQYFAYQQLIAANLNKLVFGSGQPLITAGMLKRMYVICPPPVEQEKINAVLKLWDTAIEKQSKLIEKLKLRKRALMQQLLTGKKRLSGFNGEWKKVKLGSIAEIVGGGTPNTNISHYWNGGIPWFTPTEIGKTKYVSESKKTISAHGQNNSSAKILPKGTILFTSRATIGAKAILTVEATTNQGFQSLIVHNNNNNEFIYYYLDIILTNIKQKASGSTFTEISAESMRRTEIIIPPKEEQNAIVSIFVNADKEIELANEKLASLQSQKRGLMQQLLTGKKRFV
ncbi:MAG: restriction endonuclease subunit S [Prevotella sp.]|nr:restriction endonuclease subunit S [Prevotella sp.]